MDALSTRLLSVLCIAGATFGFLRPVGARSEAAGASAPSADPAPAVLPVVHGLAPLPGDAEVPLSLRPPGARPGDGGPSPVIFPRQKLTLRFNHRLHVEGEALSCVSCHATAASSDRASDRVLPKPEVCDQCHGTDHSNLEAVTAASDQLIAQCGYCHLGYVDGDPRSIERLSIPPPRMNFSHRAHAERSIGCAQCHGAVAQLELATRDQLPRMQGCFRCHQMTGPAAGDARGECTVCHLADESGRMASELTTGTLVPPRWMGAADHGPGWLERHREVAAADSRFCASCHSESDCADCHDGRVRPRDVHPNDWLSIHAGAARRDSPRCSSCHQSESFCVTCHQRTGVTQSGPYGNAVERGRFHPPPGEWTNGPRTSRHHGWEAQRNAAACVSCHSERDCVTCHSAQVSFAGGRSGDAGSLGSGLNPHPSDFRVRCASALRKNPRPCLVCHDPADARLASCR